MSKYTTEVRFICEQAYIDWYNAYIKLHPEESVPSVENAELNAIIDKGCDKIFWKNKETPDYDYENVDNQFPIYDENHRKELCFKILKHYYTREIAAETFGLWKLWLNERMNEIMPYYNQLYESADIQYNPLYDVDYKRSGNKSGLGTSENTRESEVNRENNYIDNGKETGERHSENDNKNTSNGVNEAVDKFSETPQNNLTGLYEDKYLTTADIKTQSDISNKTGHSELDDETSNEYLRSGIGVSNDKANGNDKNINTNNDMWEEEIKGKMAGKSFAKMIMEYREAILNIDTMIIKDLKDLFFYLW